MSSTIALGCKIHCEVSFISGLKTGQIDCYVEKQWACTMSFNLFRLCFNLHWAIIMTLIGGMVPRVPLCQATLYMVQILF